MGLPERKVAMLALLLILGVLFLIFGGVGLFVHGLIWLFWIALILLILDVIFGLVRGRGTRL